MIDNLLVEDLANAPPQTWALMMQRAPVLERYAALELTPYLRRSAAAELRVTPRHFGKLIGSYLARRTGASPARPMTGFGCWIGEAKEQVIAQAITNVGPGARESEVRCEVVRLSVESGVETPSETAIRRRFGRTPFALDLRARLRTDCDVLVDVCGLELNLEDELRVAPAHLLALIDTNSGRTLTHRLFAGLPGTSEMATMVTDVLTSSMLQAPIFSSICLTNELQAAVGSSALPAACKAYYLPEKNSRLRTGAAIKAVFGSRIGRVPVRGDPRVWDKPASSAAVPVEAAGSVISHLVAQRNSALPPVLCTSLPVTPGCGLARMNAVEDGHIDPCELVSDTLQAA